ncbi:MAG: DUF3179 domain-containing protein [Albidovulum sp.]|nr:DUF3179 domain-containing protein [Albidovulum sp.]
MAVRRSATEGGFSRTATWLAAGAIFLSAACSASANPSVWEREWPKTDFSIHSVDFAEIMSGGPPKDGIPAIDSPEFIPVSSEASLSPREGVLTLELEGEAPRAYPVRYLLWHEIVNDSIGDTPVAVTYCPLCNSAIFFDRRVGGELRSFGVSGKLRKSDMVMYDRETESWWQQAVGEGIVGIHTGDELAVLPGWMESWEEFATRNPDGLVMAQPTFPRSYGRNPYVGYDTSQRPFLFFGELPPHEIHPLARIVRVGDSAWPLQRLSDAGELTEDGISFSWKSGQSSALDTSGVGEGRDIGTIRVRNAASGEDLPHDVMFAFAFHAFYPEGAWKLAN